MIIASPAFDLHDNEWEVPNYNQMLSVTAEAAHCRAGSSANNLTLYLAMCVRFGMQSIHDSTVPAYFAFHAFNMQPHACMMEESSADRNQRLARLRAQGHRA